MYGISISNIGIESQYTACACERKKAIKIIKQNKEAEILRSNAYCAINQVQRTNR